MAFRGRGRGRGGGGGFRAASQQKFELFPKLLDEESLLKGGCVKEQPALMIWSWRLQNFWKSSPYYLENIGKKKEESADIERYSDRGKKRKLEKDKLSDFIKCTIDYVPAELAQDSRPQRHRQKKLTWNQNSGLKKFDLFEKLEQKGENGKGGKKEDGENEEEDDENIEEEEEELSDDGDYNQNVDFDDDEDDFNMADDNDDEGIY